MNIDFDAKMETRILLGMIVFFSAAGAVSLGLDQPPVVTAISFSLVITACLYRFLGGVEGSRLAVASFKAGGSAAVFGAALWYVTGQLVALNPTVQPPPPEWMAMDRNGAPVGIRIGQDSVIPDPSLLEDAVWSVENVGGAIRAAAGDRTLARIDLSSLGSVGLFNQVRMPDGRAIRFTGELARGMEADLFPYPFRIRATDFRDSYNGYAILGRDGDAVIVEDVLITRTFKVFSHDGEYFAVLVSRAVHNDPGREPWAVFGFAQFELSVDAAAPE